MTLTELLDEAVDSWPDRVCLIDGEDIVTYRELRERAGKAAALLRRLGVGAGDAIAVWLRSSSAWVEIQFAVARLGAVAIAVNNRFAVTEMEDLARRTRAGVLVLGSSDAGPGLPGRLASLRHRFRAVIDCSPGGTLTGAVDYTSAGALAPTPRRTARRPRCAPCSPPRGRRRGPSWSSTSRRPSRPMPGRPGGRSDSPSRGA